MKRLLAVALSLFVFAGCSKDTTGGGGGGTLIGAGADFLNTSFVPTILKCDLLLDGRVIATETHAGGTEACILVGTANISNGNHTLAFRITDQSTSPNEYQTLGTLVQSGTGSVTKTLGDKTQTLSTGGSIEYSFTWP